MYAAYIYIYTAICTSRRYARNYVRIVHQGLDYLRLKPGVVAEPVAGAMAKAPLRKNDGDWVPKRSSFMCVCVANMAGKRLLSSMTVRLFGLWTTSFYTAKENVGCVYLFLLYKAPPLSPVLIRKGQDSVSSGKSRQLGNFHPCLFQVLILNVSWI